MFIFFFLRLVQLQAHWDYYQYRAPGAGGITNANEDVDGTIVVDEGSHPRVYVDAIEAGQGAEAESEPISRRSEMGETAT